MIVISKRKLYDIIVTTFNIQLFMITLNKTILLISDLKVGEWRTYYAI